MTAVQQDAGTVEDQAEIEHLIYQYARAFDSGDTEALDELFMGNAVIDATSLNWRGHIAQRYEAWFGCVPAPRGALPSGIGGHQMLNHLYTIDAGTASGVTYCITYFSPDDVTDPTFRLDYIRYRDTLVKHDSRWRFLRREVQIFTITPPIPVRLFSGTDEESDEFTK